MSKTTRRRLLFVAPAMPDSGGNGLAMRQGMFLAAYSADYDIDLAVIPLAGPAAADDRFARRHVQRLQVFALDNPDTLFTLILRIKDHLERIEAFEKYGRPSLTARLGPGLQRTFMDWIADRCYSLMHTGRLYLLGLGAGIATPHVVDADEDDARVFRQIAVDLKHNGRDVESRWAAAEAGNSARMAKSVLPAVRHVFTASHQDAMALAPFSNAVTVIPNTLARPWLRGVRRGPHHLLFVGTLGYAPNADAITWFIKNCWPSLHKLRPLLRLDVVGPGASAALRRLTVQPGITYLGKQANLRRFYQQASVVIVPVHTGGGSRIKFLEAAAFARSVVATSIGAQGSCLMPKRDFAQADDPQGFSRAVFSLLGHPQRIGWAARKAVEQGHDPARWKARISAIAGTIASGGSV